MSRIISCNKCGSQFNYLDIQEDFKVYKLLRYGTKYDGCELELDLCCRCVDELIDSCVLSPIACRRFSSERGDKLGKD